MTKLKSGQAAAFYGGKDEAFVKKYVPILAEKLKVLTTEMGDGLPHDYLNMNKKDGDMTSSETIEKLFINYVDPKLAGL